MFCTLLGQDIRRAFTGSLVLWFLYVRCKSGETCVPRCFRDGNHPKMSGTEGIHEIKKHLKTNSHHFC